MNLNALGDHSCYRWSGDPTSVSLPISLSLALDEGFVTAGQRVAMLGIGSGLQCSMLGVEW